MILTRQIINALLPEGAAWEPKEDDDYNRLLNGIAENSDSVKLQIDTVRYIRDPYRTPFLSDLEKEYGIIPLTTATEAERRDRLYAFMFIRSELPTYESLEAKLQAAGFNVQVHVNSPAVDPATFLNEAFQMTAGDLLPGGNDAQCGEPEAYCGRTGGYLLVNGDIFLQSPNYTILCDEAEAQCGEADALAGNFDSISLVPIEYTLPTTAGYWPLIFFVGGDATRNALGEITNIDIVSIPNERQAEFKRIILQHKPTFSWAALIVVWS